MNNTFFHYGFDYVARAHISHTSIPFYRAHCQATIIVRNGWLSQLQVGFLLEKLWVWVEPCFGSVSIKTTDKDQNVVFSGKS